MGGVGAGGAGFANVNGSNMPKYIFLLLMILVTLEDEDSLNILLISTIGISF